ncbi:TPA: hypothetical protein I8Y25_002165 [Raoultella ornithinolytica]|nr:hypothetical protein [Raoultella ornithinolytica]HAT1613992.1 hypothetical protein [Raoultella ornithinolytica]
MAIKGAPRPGLQSIAVDGETYYVDAFPIRDRESRLKWQGIIINPTKAIAHTVVKYTMMTMGVLLLILIPGLLMVCLVLSRVVKPLQDIVRKADLLVLESIGRCSARSVYSAGRRDRSDYSVG